MIQNKIQTLSFSESSCFDAIIALNANLPDKNVFETLKGRIIISADGAADKLISMQVMPDLVIGDLDSFLNSDSSIKIEPSKILHFADQETNDFEKILLYCQRNNLNNLLIVGFHGGDLEHTFNNWSVFKKYVHSLNLTILDKNRYAFCVDRHVKLLVNRTEIISLIPQVYAKLSTSGLKWNLSKEVLEIGTREGARNEAVSGEVFIEIHEGELLVFINSRLPYSPIFSPM